MPSGRGVSTLAEWYALASTHSGIVIEPLNPLDAIGSTQLPGEFHKDPADRILVAISRRYGIPLVTCDEKILSYPHVQTVW
ncbi:MAG: PIN domain-containing protein [Geitlerinemataceae cyanobacterium]